VLRVSARADGYSEQMRQVQAPAMGVRLALTPASSIAGRTISEEGVPIGGVRVTAAGRDGLWAAPRVAHSREDGTFRLNDLPAGRYVLTAVSEHWRSDERSVQLGVAHTTDPIDLMLRAATRLTAVVKVAGTPCEEGSVSLSGTLGGFAALEQEGRAVFEGILPGRYRVSVECEAGVDQSDWLDMGLEPVTRVWDLHPGQRITGVALTPAGAPLVGVSIEVNPVDEPFGRTTVHCTTDDRGEFSCAGLAPGDYECAIGYGLPLRSDSVRVAVSEEAAPHVILNAHGEGAIRVRIEDPDSFELQALPLVARGKAGTLLGELEGDEFVFEPLALGRYEIANESSPPGAGRLVELTRDGQVAELTLVMPSPDTLSGRVLGEDGQGIPDAWVRASLASLNALPRPVTPVLTDAEGVFSLTGLLPGNYRLVVSSSQGEAQLDEVASDSHDVLVRLPSYGSLAVSLRSAAGSAVGDFVVAYRRSDNEWSEQAPGSHGAWSAPWLAPGRYELTAKAAEGSVTQTVELPPGGEVSVALRLDPQPRESAPHASESSAGPIGAGR
jgi:protocatechuate 3,4-dioxygenase beta subunit